MLKNYLKIALRTLLRGKVYTVLNVFGLATGLACFGLIAAWCMDELSYDRFQTKHERIFRIAGKVTTDSETFDQAVTAPVALSLTRPDAFSRISVRINTTQISETIKFIEYTWRKHFPGALLQYSFMDERLDRQYHAEKLFGKIFMTFVVLSLAIACVGLFGLAAFAAEQRTKEIGIRKVLGASLAGILSLLSRDFVKLVLCANILAWPLAYFVMNEWLQNFAYRINIGWWVFVLAGGSALLIALLTVSTQALKAALANPVEALRYE